MTARQIRADLRTAAAEVWESLPTWPTWQRDLWLGSVAFFVALVALHLPHVAQAWFVVVVLAASCAVLYADRLDLKRERDSARAELAHADAMIRTLSHDLLDAQTRLYDAVNEAAHAPAPVIPLVPRQRDGSEYEWPHLAREIQNDDLTALIRATEEN